MIDVHLVVQRERVVSAPPVIADARPTIDDQRIDAELRQARSDRKPGLSAADDQHLRMALAVIARGFPQVAPGRTAESARIAMAARSATADVLLVAFQLIERGEKRPCLTVAQPEHAASPSDVGLEAEDRLDAFRSGARYFAGRGAARVDFEATRIRLRRVRCQFGCQSLRTADS